MGVPQCWTYNVVVLPVTAFGAAEAQRFQLSASRADRAQRMVSPAWTESEVRHAFGLAEIANHQVEALFRGNRMTLGGRSSTRLFFTEEQLTAMGLAVVEPAAEAV